MKNFIKFAAVALIVTAFTTNANAQFKASAGLDLGMVLNEGMGLTYGLSVGGELGISDHIAITAILGYSMVSLEGDGASMSLMPYQAGFKYYFSDNEGGFYAHAQVGMTTYKQTVDLGMFGKHTFSGTDLSIAPGVGYMINEHIDLGARYHMVLTEGESLNWVAIRAAYVF